MTAPIDQRRAADLARTFVLVHGAWHGGWCWRAVADILASLGHQVFTPTLTGLGERSHLMSHAITLDTHIDDIVSLFERERLSDVILCAHSYGGWPVSGALEYISSQVSAIVFLDAHVPEDGERGVTKSHHRQKIETAMNAGIPYTEPPLACEFWVKPENRAYVQSKMTGQPVGVSQQPIRLTGARERIANKMYIRADGFPSKTFNDYRDTVRGRGWETESVPCGHDVMIDEPELLTEILLRVASGARPNGKREG
jgi:pimeloyl-ACP methyl ester carboxylesterase